MVRFSTKVINTSSIRVRGYVDEIWSAVHRGGARGGRLSVDGACNQKLDGDTRRRDSDLDRFGPSDRRNTLCPVSLVCCIEM